jgi:phosphate-selective porin OprO/OprP
VWGAAPLGVPWRGLRASVALAASALCCALVAAHPPRAAAAEAPAAQSSPTPTDERDAAESETLASARQFSSWNHYEGPYATLRFGFGFLYDFVGYAQDENSKEQMTLHPTNGVRDFRLLFKGTFPKLPRLSWTLGYMYDGAVWKFRQTGLMFQVPELLGDIFIGRTKEGFSTNKIMVGYYGWTTERSTMSDALIPILADGIKWTGRIPSGKLVYNVGYFFDEFSEPETFNKNDSQFVARAVWLPNVGTDKPLVHLALEGRWAEANNGQLQYRSKPESYLAQSYAIDTGKFPASHANSLGIEAYYRPGSLMFGTEYYFTQVSSPEKNNPFFHGGEIFASYLFTGETHPYNAKGAFFGMVVPARSVFEGGPGAIEAVLRFSYSDLDSGLIEGGKFWRITPMMNWYLSDNLRLEFTYGFGQLDRFGLRGYTQFFQGRVQVAL